MSLSSPIPDDLAQALLADSRRSDILSIDPATEENVEARDIFSLSSRDDSMFFVKDHICFDSNSLRSSDSRNSDQPILLETTETFCLKWFCAGQVKTIPCHQLRFVYMSFQNTSIVEYTVSADGSGL